MASNKYSQIIDLNVATPKELKALLRLNSIDLLETIKKIHTPEEEERLADTQPGYETFANKAKRAREFFIALTFEIDKEIYFHLLFIADKEKKLSDLMAKIEYEDRYVDEQNKLLSIQSLDAYKIIENEIINEKRLFLEFLENKILMLDNLIAELDDKIQKLEERKEMIEESIVQNENSLITNLNNRIDALIPDKSFVLNAPHDEALNNKYGIQEAQIHIDPSQIKNAFKKEAADIVKNCTSKNKIDESKFANNFLYDVYNQHLDKANIPTEHRDKFIQDAMKGEDANELKKAINIHVRNFNDMFAKEIDVEIPFKKLQGIHESRREVIGGLALFRNARAIAVDMRQTLFDAKENETNPNASRQADPNFEASFNQNFNDLQARVNAINPTTPLSSDDLLKNLIAEMETPSSKNEKEVKSIPTGSKSVADNNNELSSDDLLKNLMAQMESQSPDSVAGTNNKAGESTSTPETQTDLSSDALLKNLMAQMNDQPPEETTEANNVTADSAPAAESETQNEPSSDDLLKNLMAQFDAQPTEDVANDNNPAAEPDPEANQSQPKFTNNGLGLFSHRKSDRSERKNSKNDAAFEERASSSDKDEVKKDKGEPDQEPPKLH